MPDSTESYTERIVLEVDAPKGNLDSPNSGLNIALARLREIEATIKSVQASYSAMIAQMGRNPFSGVAPPGTTGRGGGSGGGGGGSSSGTTGGSGEVNRRGELISRRRVEGEVTQERFQIDPRTIATVKFKASPGGSVETITQEDTDFRKPSKGRQEAAATAKGREEQEKLIKELRAEQQRTMDEAKAEIEADIAGRIAIEKARQKASEEAAKQTANERRQEEKRISDLRKRQQKAFTEASRDAGQSTEQAYTGHLLSQAQRRNMALGGVPTGIPDQERLRQVALIKASEAKSNEMAARAAQSSSANRAAALPPGAERRSAARDVMDYGKEAVKWQSEYVKQTMAARNAADKFAESTRHIGKNMVDNIQHVTAWAASVFVLYGSIQLLTSSLSSMIEIEYQTARLAQVLRSSFESQGVAAEKLKDQVLLMAAADGRSSKEAMESAIAWSRLGLNRVQVAEAVRVSLEASNVAELTAAQATDHLSSLMVVYGLRVSELSGVLGMLNQVSNVYNVTNANLLNGLTRTASVAKQAGIPLGELIGMIGAGVGATGQTGANIGNMLKSITGSLSSPDTLKNLREKFNFEGTNGKGELKNMSELLSELFVAYNKMGEAERRSMLFSVAGKNQASRMAALLDNYVKSQTLAITAQLNLNSAELENARIKATLKSQLIGLATEWDRFISKQGARGPVAAMTEVAKSMHNVLRLANAPGANVAFTALEYIAVGVAAKMALTAYQMAEVGKKGSYVKNSFVGIKQAAGEVGSVLNQVAARSSRFGGAGGWFGGAIKQSALPDLKNFREMLNFKGAFVQGDDGKLKRVIQDSKTLAFSLKEVGFAAKAARVAIASISDVLVPMLAIMAVMYGINAAVEAMGFTSDKMNEKVDRLGDSAQKAENAANAHEMRGRLIRNVQNIFEDPHTTEEARLKLAQSASEAIAPYNSSDTDKQRTAKEALRTARLQELQDIARIKIEEERNAKSRAFWDREEGEAFAERSRKRQEAREQMRLQMTEIDAEIKKLESSPFGHKDAIANLKQKREEVTNKRIGSYLEETTDNEESRNKFRETDTAFKSFVAGEKAMLEDLKHLWDSLPGDSYIDKINKDIAAQEFMLDLLKKQVDAKDKAAEAAGIPDQGMTEAQAQYEAESKAIGDYKTQVQKAAAEVELLAKINSFAQPEVGPSAEDIKAQLDAQQRLNDLKAQEGVMQQRMEDNETLRSQIQTAKANPDYKRIEEERDSLRKDRDAAEVALNASKTRTTLAEVQDRRNVIMRLAKSEASSFGVGDGSGQQFSAEVAGLRSSIAKKEILADQLQKNGNVQEAENVRLEALQHRVMLTDMLIRGEEMLRELHKDELNLMIAKNREYQRSLLTAGPSELLRRLAVNQLAPQGKSLTAGSFFAFDQGARQDILSRPENDEQIKELKRSQAALRAAGFGSKNNGEIQNEFVTGANDRRRIFSKMAPGSLPDIESLSALSTHAKKAADGLAAVASSAGTLITRFDALASRVDTLFNGGFQPPRAQNNPNA
jgi:TP901 family phage tail tape measure protein